MKPWIRLLYLSLVLLLASHGVAATPNTKLPAYPALTDPESFNGPTAFPSEGLFFPADDFDVIGDTMVIGTTWYDNMGGGTLGRLVEKDSTGYLHFVWTKALDASTTNRHVFYNFVDPQGMQGFPASGCQVDFAVRAGFPVVDVGFGGCAFPTFHQVSTGWNAHVAVAFDLLPHVGAFTTFEPSWLYIGGQDIPLLWPKMQMSRDGRLHIIATEEAEVPGMSSRVYYTVGTYEPLNFVITFPAAPNTWTYVDTCLTVAADVAASEVSDRIALGWTHSRLEGIPGFVPNPMDNDVYLLIDEDGFNPDFSQAVNLTNFIPPDLSYLPNITLANMDTLRAYCDMSLFFDQDNWLHVAFTTRAFFAIQAYSYWHPSIIWHWTEQYPDEFRMIHNAFDDYLWNFVSCGSYDVKAQRPSLGQDPATGYLYCAYQVYDTDTLHLSHAGCPSGETYVSVSMDGGMNWSVGTNVTQTITSSGAPAGHCKSELTPSLAKLADGDCHISYVFDRDAGCYIQYQGEAFLNPVIYHRVPASQIPVLPFVEQNVPFHVEHAANPTSLSLSLVPLTSPIVIPANGGSFDFYAVVTNDDSVAQATELWTRAVLPGNILSAPLFGPMPITLLPGVRSWYRVQNVPASAPAGNYAYWGYLGDYPAAVADSDCFTFSKSYLSDGSPGADNWLNSCDLLSSAPSAGPAECRIIGIRPNPFNPIAAISYQLSADCRVSLRVYDIAGKLVATPVDGWKAAGTQEATVDGSNLASGIYLYRLTAGSFDATGKLILLR